MECKPKQGAGSEDAKNHTDLPNQRASRCQVDRGANKPEARREYE